MTRWLEAARRATGETHERDTQGVLSVLSVLSELGRPEGRAEAKEPARWPAIGTETPRRFEPAPITERAKARAATLPTAPPTCALCGAADWQVSLTDTKRRTLHVACWRAEQGGGARENAGCR